MSIACENGALAAQASSFIPEPFVFYHGPVPDPPFTDIDHVQLAMPRGGEQVARRFYGEILGMMEIPKPAELAMRGGCWFTSGEVQIHLGVEDEFRPARKAHPALRCQDYESLKQQLQCNNVNVVEADDIPGVRRCHIFDPFGNRIELVAD
jgi:catechol 2,3-dioxygenase-like lactoylglutathione lyase family enzyme